jgi:hypothetical protein
MSTSPSAAQAAADNRQFWLGVAKLPEPAQKSFWDGGTLISQYIGENPSPRTLTYDFSAPTADMPWYERIFFYLGQSSQNQAVSQLQMGQQMLEGAAWLASALQGDFNKSPTTGQMITGGIISMIPIVDQVCDVRDIVANCINLSDPKAREEVENWVALGLTCIGFVPLFGSAAKTVGKVALHNANKLIDLLKHMEWLEKHGKSLKMAIPWGHAPIEWLKKFDWQNAMRQAAEKAKAAFANAKHKAEHAAKYAFGVVQAKLKQLVELFDAIIKKIADVMADIGKRIKEKIDKLLGNAKKEAGNYDATPGGPNRHGQGDREPPSPGSVRTLRKLNREELAEWYKKQHPKFENPDVLNGHMAGTDFTKPVLLKELPEGTEVVQYVRTDGKPGMYFAYPGTQPAGLAIASEGRELQRFTLSQPMQVVESTAAEFPVGKVPGIGGPGGSSQLLFPSGWESTVSPLK